MILIINGVKDKKLLNDEIIEKIDNIRKLRNTIHIKVFSISDNSDDFSDLYKIFVDIKDILDFIEKKIKT